MSFATFTPNPAPANQPSHAETAPVQLSAVEHQIASRIVVMVENGWTWGKIAEAAGITVAQAVWFYTHA